jgi:hypothetical protein
MEISSFVLTIPVPLQVGYKGFSSCILCGANAGKLKKIIMKYTDRNFLFKDDDTHVFIVINNSVAIKLKMNTLENKILPNQFILSLKNPDYI